MIDFIKRNLQKYRRRESYRRLQLSPSILQSISNYTDIRRPFDNLASEITASEKWNYYLMGSRNIRKHRFSKYYYELADYLNKRETILLGEKLSRKYWENFSVKKKDGYIKIFRNTIGYHDEIPPQGTIRKIKTEVNRFERNIDILDFVGRFGIGFPVYRGRPEHGISKGIVLAVHGRGSGPDYVMGLTKKDDYTRHFGDYWLRKGYTIYAPQTDFAEGVCALYRLNYSDYGHDIAKLKDLIKFIEENEDQRQPLIAMGVSYGGYLAEWISILSNQVDALVSIGATARGDTFSRLLSGNRRWYVSPESKMSRSSLPLPYHFYFNGPRLFRLIAPKPLVISVGIHDWGEEKFPSIFEVADYYKQNGWGERFGLNIFYGFHEVDAEGDYLALQKLVKNKILDKVAGERYSVRFKNKETQHAKKIR